MNNPIPRIGLAGLGGFAQQHITVLTTLQEAGLCQLVAVADPFAEKHQENARALTARGAKIFDSLEEMLQGIDLEAVFLATPLPLHMPQAVACLEAGKHVYLEKPPCATLHEYAVMARAQEAAGKQLVVGFQMQHAPAFRFLRQCVAEGQIGEVSQVWASTRWSRTDAYYNRAPWAGKWSINGTPVFDGPATNALAHVVQAAISLGSSDGVSMPALKNVNGMLRRARPLESYDSAYLEVKIMDGPEIRLAFTHSTGQGDVAMLRCTGSLGQATLDWGGKVTLTPHGRETRHFTFWQQPGTIATLDFFEGLRRPETSKSVTLQDTLPYLQAVNGARQASHGALDFCASQVVRQEMPDSKSYYEVKDLDLQFEEFGRNFDSPPGLLRPTGPPLAVETLPGHLVDFS